MQRSRVTSQKELKTLGKRRMPALSTGEDALSELGSRTRARSEELSSSASSSTSRSGVDNDSSRDQDDASDSGSATSSSGESSSPSKRKSGRRNVSYNGSRSPISSSQRHRRSGTSKARKARRDKHSGFFVLEYQLERPPRRRTRPTEEGETIGDVIFFGDDLMFGTLAEGNGRLSVPWPERIRQRLVDEAGLRMVMSGLPGRTSRWNDEELAKSTGEWAKPEDFNGLFAFGTLFSSHSPLWLIIALGTNDLKKRIRDEAIERANDPDENFSFRLDLSPSEREENHIEEEEEDEDKYEMDEEFIAKSVASLALQAKRMFAGHCHEGVLKIVLVVPPPIRLTPSATRAGFDSESKELSQKLPPAFMQQGKEHGFHVVVPMNTADKLADGVHLTDDAAGLVAEEVWKVIASELPRRPKRVALVDM